MKFLPFKKTRSPDGRRIGTVIRPTRTDDVAGYAQDRQEAIVVEAKSESKKREDLRARIKDGTLPGSLLGLTLSEKDVILEEIPPFQRRKVQKRRQRVDELLNDPNL